jgi:lipid kinase YegS
VTAVTTRRAQPRHLALIMHGARADQPALRHLVAWVRGKGHRVEPWVTWERGDGERFAREAAARGVDAVVAVGGDGTVNEVLNGLRDARVPLGIIPLGTANDFARQVGIPDDPDHAMDVILRRKPVRIDSAELNGRRFVNVSTGGLGAEATAETPAEAKAQLGALAYALTGVRKLADLSPHRARITGPGFAWDGDLLLFAVANAPRTGGGVHIAPKARTTDGLLDVVIVEAMPRADFARLALRLKRGEHLDAEGVHYAQLPDVLIEAAAPLAVNVDGEHSEATRLAYAARPGDLLVHVKWLPEESRP